MTDLELMREALKALESIEGKLIWADRILEQEYIADEHGHVLSAGQTIGQAKIELNIAAANLRERLLQE